MKKISAYSLNYQTLDDTGDYPKFEKFVKFVAKEKRMACNPISSLYAHKGVDPPDAAKDAEKEVKYLAKGIFTEMIIVKMP